MITKKIELYKYDWTVTVLIGCDCSDITLIEEYLNKILLNLDTINCILDSIQTLDIDVGFTYTNYNSKLSIIILSKTSKVYEYINVATRECCHLICHLQDYLNIKDEEELATLAGKVNVVLTENMLYDISQ